MTASNVAKWYTMWEDELRRDANRFLKLKGQDTLRDAFLALASLEVDDGAKWHLLVARSDGTWAVARFDELHKRAEAADSARMDMPLDELDWLHVVKAIDVGDIGIDEAKAEAQGAVALVLVLTDEDKALDVTGDDNLAGIVYVGAQLGVSTSPVPFEAFLELAGPAEPQPEAVEDSAEQETVEAGKPRRLPTFRFYDCKDDPNCDQAEPWPRRALQAKHWYWLDIAIKSRVEEDDVQPKDREHDIVPLPEKLPEDATLFISLAEDGNYGLFEFANQTAALKLTPEGISENRACFKLSPREVSVEPMQLIVRIHYKNNLLQRLRISVKVVGTLAAVTPDPDAQRYGVEEVRDLTLIPQLSEKVKIHLDIDRDKQHSGTYTLAVTAGDVQLFGTGQFMASDFEKWINQARDVIYAVSCDYAKLQGATEWKATQLFLKHVKELATVGRRIWNGIFNNPNSDDLQAIAKWWRENRPAYGSVIQIDLRGALEFVIPWGIMFDSPLRPTLEDEAKEITLNDFWGLRYQIEHNTHGAPAALPPIYPTKNHLPFAVMVGAEPLGEKHFEKIRAIAEHTKDQLLKVHGPIKKPGEARKLFNMDGISTSEKWPLVYFFGHAYTRKATGLAIRDGVDMFCKWYNETADDPAHERYSATAEVFCTEKFGGTYSYFELYGGSVKPEDELDVDAVNLQYTRPLVFFNACQSAQNSPSPSGGWVHLLISQGAGGYLGTEVFIDAQFAQDFGVAFWEAFLSGQTAGEAVLTARRRFAEKKMLQGLAYTHYGPAGVRLQERILISDGESDLGGSQVP